MRRTLQAAVVMLGFVYALAQLANLVPTGGDAGAYWLADPLHPYVHSTLGDGFAYLYSPAFAQVISPLRLLPWPYFSALWVVLLFGALALTARGWGLLLILVPPVLSSIALGNIEVFMAAAIVVGFRYPAAWSFILLTKVTPGVGLLWFAVRREWRPLIIAGGVTAAVVAVSFVIAPNAWFEWIDSLRLNAAVTFPGLTLPGPLWLRVLLATGIVAWGARTDRRWTVPVAAALAMPVAYITLFALLLVGVVGILEREPGGITVPAALSARLRLRSTGQA